MWVGSTVLCQYVGGRFIPCRGGGTDTTYYMDWHDVGEDVMTRIPRDCYKSLFCDLTLREVDVEVKND